MKNLYKENKLDEQNSAQKATPQKKKRQTNKEAEKPKDKPLYFSHQKSNQIEKIKKEKTEKQNLGRQSQRKKQIDKYTTFRINFNLISQYQQPKSYIYIENFNSILKPQIDQLTQNEQEIIIFIVDTYLIQNKTFRQKELLNIF